MSEEKKNDPAEVIEMRKSLAELGRTVREVRKARESHRGLARPVIAPKRDESGEITKKIDTHH